MPSSFKKTMTLSLVDPSTDLTTSWIYKLKKDDINIELDVTGNVDEKRKRLVRFIESGRQSPKALKNLTDSIVFPPICVGTATGSSSAPTTRPVSKLDLS
ncbi:hypothetical protein HHI36_001168 [Cryptolaemus montrouzieri]|uniref:Uncharacterized protein n=1 Tax=Cryptolaemus montrouzieri TaxID=559131 RepID=A0ABD2P7J0_9CUCU